MSAFAYDPYSAEYVPSWMQAPQWLPEQQMYMTPDPYYPYVEADRAAPFMEMMLPMYPPVPLQYIEPMPVDPYGYVWDGYPLSTQQLDEVFWAPF
jgi:hypothetical protein